MKISKPINSNAEKQVSLTRVSVLGVVDRFVVSDKVSEQNFLVEH